MTARVLVRGLIFIASLVAVGYLLQASALDKAWIDTDIRGQGIAGEALFVAVGVLFTAIGLPRQIVAFLAGYAFGLVTGTALAVLAMVGGCVLAFVYARLLGREFVASRFPARVGRIDAFLRDNPFSMTLLIRFLPVGSNLLTNLAAGVSSVGALAFIVGSAIGYIPQALVFALAGSGITIDPVARISLSIALFVFSGILGIYLYRRNRHGRRLDDDLERQIGDDAAPTAEAERGPVA
jgi:uncharacterized membrane protein YdjX (TVP38/TMEM64 family)